MKLKSPDTGIGTSAARYLTLLVEDNRCIDGVSLMTYDTPPTLQSRLSASSEVSTIVNKALILRDSISMPFWDAAMLNCFSNGGSAKDLLGAALFHQRAQSRRWAVSREDVLNSALHLANESGHGIAFCSELLISGESVFMPLIDFHCPECAENDGLVRAACELLTEFQVAVFRSGKSYHAYVLCAISPHELRQMLCRALLLAPIVDKAYLAHQLLEDCCALRINATESKPYIPDLKFVVGKAH